jgi:GntR family transcriptional repressor for pyruvate dehydrogenase complex
MFLESPHSIKQKKISQQIVDVIRRAILSGEVEGGEKLPSEPDLIQKFNVSRQTVREALCALEVMGLIKLRAGLGGGAFVTEVDVKIARDGLANFLYDKDFTIQNITEVRLALEPNAAAMAAVMMLDQDFGMLADILEKCRTAIEQEEDAAIIRRLEISFHAIIVQAINNPIWILLHDFVEYLLWDVKTQLKTQSKFSRQVLAMHEKILEALVRRDPEAASALMRQDIIEVEASLVSIAGKDTKLRFH